MFSSVDRLPPLVAEMLYSLQARRVHEGDDKLLVVMNGRKDQLEVWILERL